MRGDTGQQLFSIFDSNHQPDRYPFIAVGDIDNDGFNEIVTVRQSNQSPNGGSGLLAYDHTGQLKWDNRDIVAAYNANKAHTPIYLGDQVPVIIADIDNDGKPEIIAETFVFNGDGTVKWTAPYSNGGYSYDILGSGISTVVDLDLDGKQEILSGNTVYNSDGSLKWRNSSLGGGAIDIVANFDDDAYPEIIYVCHYSASDYSAKIYLLDHTGQIKWGPVT